MAERVYLSIRTSVDLKRAIRMIAAEEDTDMSSVINRVLVREFVADVIPIDGLKPGTAERKYPNTESECG